MAPSKKCKAHKEPNNTSSLRNRFFTKRSNTTSKAKERMKKLRVTEDEVTRRQRKQADAVRHNQQRATEDEVTATQRRNANAVRMRQQRSTEDKVTGTQRRQAQEMMHRAVPCSSALCLFISYF